MAPGSNGAASARWPWLLLCLVLLFVGGVRWRLRDMPLERDEGEFAYSAQSMLRGVPPYRDAYNKKFPGVAVAYAAFFELFGETPAGIHEGTLAVNAAGIVALFLLARRLWGARAAAVAAAAYALLSLDPGASGLAGHATHFVVAAALAALLVLLRGLDRDRPGLVAAAGGLFGVAILMKQPAVVFVGFAGVWTVIHHVMRRPVRWRRVATECAALVAGAVLPVVLLAVIVWREGVFRRFWFWTVVYARDYGYVGLAGAPALLRENFGYLAQRSFPLWALAAVGLLAACADRRARPQLAFAVLLAVFSFVGTSLSLVYRPHYFIMLMPAAAMFVAAGMPAARRLPAIVPAAVFCVAAAWTVWLERDVFFRMTPVEVCREIYGANPFVESPEVGKYIALHTAPDEKVAILGSEAQILFYARRPSATGYIYMYGLTEKQPHALEMQREMAAEIEAAHPRYTVLVHVPSSWLFTEDSEPWITGWLQRYAAELETVGCVELWGDRSTFVWDGDAKGCKPRSPFYLVVLRRKTGP